MRLRAAIRPPEFWPDPAQESADTGTAATSGTRTAAAADGVMPARPALNVTDKANVRTMPGVIAGAHGYPVKTLS